MKYASLLLALSATSLFGCGQPPDAPPPAAEAPQAEAAPATAPVPAVQAEATPPAPASPARQPAAAEPAPAVQPPGAPPAAAPELAHGQQIYRQACAFCHDKGVAGAPKLGDAVAWGPRLTQGTDALHASALRGKGAMPAKGGNPSLAAADVKAAVDYLVSQSR
jgi:cytochrome c5